MRRNLWGTNWPLSALPFLLAGACGTGEKLDSATGPGARVGVSKSLLDIDPNTGEPCIAETPNCLSPQDIFGPASDPPPEDSVTVSPLEFAQAINATSLNLYSARIDARAVDDQRRIDDENRDFVTRSLLEMPDLLDQLNELPLQDETLVKVGDDYELTFTDAAGMQHKVITFGPQFAFNAAAASLRVYGTRENQYAIYSQLYAGLPVELRDSLQLRRPEDLVGVDAAFLEAQNARIASLASTILKLVPPESISPKTCAEEEGVPPAPRDQTGSCTPANLFLRASTIPLRPFTTCVKDQGRRGTCVAFAVSASVEASVGDKYQRWTNLSEERLYYWAKQPRAYGDGLDVASLTSAMQLASFAYPFESRWDYNPSNSRIDLGGVVQGYAQSCVGYSDARCSNTAHQGLLTCSNLTFSGLPVRYCAYSGSATEAGAGFRISGSTQLMNIKFSAPSVDLARAFLAMKAPVIFSFNTTVSFDSAGSDGIVPFIPPVPGINLDPNRGSHAALAVGFIDNGDLPAGAAPGAGGGYFMIKNSWGSCWSDGGYAYLPYQWVARNVFAMNASSVQ